MVLLQATVVGRALLHALAQRARPTPLARGVASCVPSSRRQRRRTQRGIDRPLNPFEPDELKRRLGGCAIRSLSTQADSSPTKSLANDTWVPVYRFSSIRWGVLLARAKLLQTVGSALLVPFTYWQYITGVASLEYFCGVSAFAFSALSLLFVFSRYFNRMVGVISMTESGSHVRIGYLSFWGARRNKLASLDDVLPITEANTNLGDAIVKLRFMSTPSFLYLPTVKVEIVDAERAALLFGDLSVFNRSKKMD